MQGVTNWCRRLLFSLMGMSTPFIPRCVTLLLACLPLEERRRIHRLIAAYYHNLSQPCAEEIFAAFEHLEAAGETQDLQEAIQIAAHAAQTFDGYGQDQEWQAMLRRAELYAARLSQERRIQSS